MSAYGGDHGCRGCEGVVRGRTDKKLSGMLVIRTFLSFDMADFFKVWELFIFQKSYKTPISILIAKDEANTAS